MSVDYDLIVIGGGPAGMMCAVMAAGRGLSTAILDPNRFLGRKLRITGKGRCNVTNNCDIKEVMNNIPGDGRFLYSALNAFPPSSVMSFFENNGLPLKTERGNRVFPVSDNANDVADLLSDMCKKLDIRIIRKKADSLLAEEGRVCGVTCGETRYLSRAVCVCTGGLSYPLTGSTGDGYEFAKKLGHRVVAPRASLVPVECAERFCREIQGVSLKNVVLTVFEDGKKIYSELGEMLFTHFGVSGPLVLSSSSHMRCIGEKNYRLEIDLKPGLDEKKLDARILRDFEKYSNRELKNALSELTVSALIPVIIESAGLSPDIKVNSLLKQQRFALLNTLKHLPLTVTGLRPADEAIITAGGVDTSEINPRTMQSKLVEGLYFAGEVLNLDAYTGGFNLQIAWCTGYVAGKSVLKERDYE